jgi:hypothetical protein
MLGWILADSFPILAAVAVLISAMTLSPDQSVAHGSADSTQVLAVAALSGALSCAILEAAKRLFRVRGIYQQRQVTKWLGGGDQTKGHSAARDMLSAAGYGHAASNDMSDYRLRADTLQLFDLPIEQLAAQFGSAAEEALSQRDKYPALAQSLSRFSPDSASDESLRAVRVAVDQLQISLGNRWRRYVGGTAMWLSGLVGIVLIDHGMARDAPRIGAFAALLLGGFFAWVIRDAAAAVERWRYS